MGLLRGCRRSSAGFVATDLTTVSRFTEDGKALITRVQRAEGGRV
jgi:hypothetical protein